METQPSVNTSLQGQFLVATPFVRDLPYRHTVILLMRHTDRGSVGLVLNNNLAAGLAELSGQFNADRLAALPASDESSEEKEEASEHRLVQGCVIWPPGQLEREMNLGVWLVAPARVNAATMSDDLWSGLLRQIGRSVLQDTLHITGFPIDSRLN